MKKYLNFLVPAVWILLLSGTRLACGGDAEFNLLAQEINRCIRAEELSKGKDAAQRLLAATDKAPAWHAWAMAELAEFEARLGEDTAEKHARTAIALLEQAMAKADPNVVKRLTTSMGKSLNTLGNLDLRRGRMTEAEAEYRQALGAYQRAEGPDCEDAAMCLHNLGNVVHDTGRYAQAREFYQRALAIKIKRFGQESVPAAEEYRQIGEGFRLEGRLDAAEEYLKYALAVFEKVEGHNSAKAARALADLGRTYAAGDKFADAEACYKKVAAARGAAPNPDRDGEDENITLADLYVRQGRCAEAEPLLKNALKIYEKRGEDAEPTVARILDALTRVYSALDRHEEALAASNRELAISRKRELNPADVYQMHLSRGLMYLMTDPKAATGEFHLAMAEADRLRAQFSGNDQDRAQAFAYYAKCSQLTAAVELDLNNMAAAFDAIERGRARSLVDQMTAAKIDLLSGVPAEKANALRQAQKQAESWVAVLTRQLLAVADRKDLDRQQRRNESTQLAAELSVARARLVEIYATIRNTSPAYRQAVGRDFEPVSLDALENWLRKRKTLLLYYFTMDAGSYVIPLGRLDGTRQRAALEISNAQAAILGCNAGYGGVPDWQKVLLDDQQGILPKLSKPNPSALPWEQLATLWKILVPPADREALVQGKYECLAIVPDGPLALLPFETLVVDANRPVKYLLDAGPPITYAPSATILVNLSEEKEKPGGIAARAPVLTVGDPAYDRPAAPQAAVTETSSEPRSRLGGHLARLPYTATESKWVKDIFSDNGVAVDQLLQEKATEGNLRSAISGRRVVHLACHGLADMSYGNLFGCLALAPGAGEAVNAADDGFLTLAEIYGLDLRGCELAILSACQTNYGPRQEGEAVWALTRGFLVAGSRRVISSDWLVDDEAAASLVSYCCGGIAQGEKAGGPVNYAAALQKAKRWVRSQPKWQHPFYWAPFVLVGPN